MKFNNLLHAKNSACACIPISYLILRQHTHASIKSVVVTKTAYDLIRVVPLKMWCYYKREE